MNLSVTLLLLVSAVIVYWLGCSPRRTVTREAVSPCAMAMLACAAMIGRLLWPWPVHSAALRCHGTWPDCCCRGGRHCQRLPMPVDGSLLLPFSYWPLPPLPLAWLLPPVRFAAVVPRLPGTAEMGCSASACRCQSTVADFPQGRAALRPAFQVFPGTPPDIRRLSLETISGFPPRLSSSAPPSIISRQPTLI
jgi:hypothetical protein